MAMTLKSGFGVVQGHWKWHHLIDRIAYGFLAFHSNSGAILYGLRDSDLLVENSEIFIPYLYLAPPQGRWGDPVKMFDAGKTRMIGHLVYRTV